MMTISPKDCKTASLMKYMMMSFITTTCLLMNVLCLIDNLLSFDSNAKSPIQGLTNLCKPVIGAIKVQGMGNIFGIVSIDALSLST